MQEESSSEESSSEESSSEEESASFSIVYTILLLCLIFMW